MERLIVVLITVLLVNGIIQAILETPHDCGLCYEIHTEVIKLNHYASLNGITLMVTKLSRTLRK